MLRQFRSISLLLFFLVPVASAAFAGQAKIGDVVLSSTDRILVLAPHPDDEVLGAAGILQQAVAQKLPIKVVFLTYGDSNQWSFLLYRKYPVFFPGGVEKMGLVRHDEAINASQIFRRSCF